MRLYHFSDQNIKELKIKYFGINSYTKNDARYNIKRLFFYNSLQPKEYHLKHSQYRYTVNIPENKIYNLDDDVLNLKEKYNYDIDDILKYIKSNFTACCYTTSFLCYCVFKNIKIIHKYEYINQKYIKIN